tara:strand:- start:505 stop:849 length:345 start_codon:yes stop_codon:yes gene_type:complete
MLTRLDELRHQAEKFHMEHPEVWDMFEEFTFDRIHNGYRNYSVYTVMERIRWDLGNIGGDGTSEFKINNNIHPFYARRFMKMYPEHDGFFRIRLQKSANRPANGFNPTPEQVSK